MHTHTHTLTPRFGEPAGPEDEVCREEGRSAQLESLLCIRLRVRESRAQGTPSVRPAVPVTIRRTSFGTRLCRPTLTHELLLSMTIVAAPLPPPLPSTSGHTPIQRERSSPGSGKSLRRAGSCARRVWVAPQETHQEAKNFSIKAAFNSPVTRRCAALIPSGLFGDQGDTRYAKRADAPTAAAAAWWRRLS